MAKGDSDKKQAFADVAVIGAGPAGATAAIILAGQGYQVTLVERHALPRKASGLSWLNMRAKELLSEWKLPIKSILDCPVPEVVFHNVDFTKTARPALQGAAGFLVDRSLFANELVDAAKRAGTVVRAGSGVSRIRLREAEVIVELENETSFASKLLILATGHRGELFEQAGYSRATGSGVVWSAHVDRPIPKAARNGVRVVVVLGLDRRGGFVVFCQSEERISATVNWFGDREGAVPAFTEVCRLAFERKVIPVDLRDGIADATIIRNPVAAALDMDTHVTKHCILIGDAGGFISAASQEGLYPAIWSAQIAAGVVDEALRSRHSQDVLKTFDTAWRMKMADYLRSPNTDPQFLVPLVFSNQPMADRMAAAFFSGENI